MTTISPRPGVCGEGAARPGLTWRLAHSPFAADIADHLERHAGRITGCLLVLLVAADVRILDWLQTIAPLSTGVAP